MSTRNILIFAAAALVAVLGMVGATAFLMMSQGEGVTGNLTAANAKYQPTSVWMEDGLDPNVTKFGFDGKATKNPTGREVSEADVYAMVQEKHHSLMPCYAKGLEEDDDLQGKVDMRFGIAPDGHIAMVKVTRSTLRSKSTEDCFVQAARKWGFPATGRSTLMKFDTDFTFVYE